MNNRFYELQFEIENACLLDCIHCSSAEMRRNGSRSYSDEDILRFISLFKDKVHIYFTGGEPLLYKHLLNLCTQITLSNPNVELGLYTTGNCSTKKAISEDLATSMYEAGIKDCYFSIYSNKEEEHDSFTALEGSLANTIESIIALRNTNILPKAHLVLNKFNLGKIREVITFCQEIGIAEVRILKLTPSGNAKEHWDQIGVPLNDQNELIKQLIQKRLDYTVKLTFSGYPDLHPCRPWENADGCQAGINLLYIDADGYVFPCACTKRSPNLFCIGHISQINKIQEYMESKERLVKNECCLNELNH